MVLNCIFLLVYPELFSFVFFLTRTLILLFNLFHLDADATIRLEDFTLLLPIVKDVKPKRIMSVCCFCYCYFVDASIYY